MNLRPVDHVGATAAFANAALGLRSLTILREREKRPRRISKLQVVDAVDAETTGDAALLAPLADA